MTLKSDQLEILLSVQVHKITYASFGNTHNS